MDAELKSRIDQMIASHRVLLFMKGNKAMPACGFSARAVSVLNGAGAQFETVDILKDEALRQGMKEYSNWPTFPQCYVAGKFVGGSDILVQLSESGELGKMVAGA